VVVSMGGVEGGGRGSEVEGRHKKTPPV